MATITVSVQLTDDLSNVIALESRSAQLKTVSGQLDMAPLQLAIGSLVSVFWTNVFNPMSAKYLAVKTAAGI